MGDVPLNLEMVQQIVLIAETYRKVNRVRGDEMGVALSYAGFCILSSGMNEIQFRATIEQIATMSAELRKQTEARWRRKDFKHDTDVVVPCVHILHQGYALCGIISPPSGWPAGHSWVGIDNLANATCEGCLKSYSRHFQPEKGASKPQ